MSFKFEILNPLTSKGWNDILIASPEYSIFHSKNWARVLHDSYHYTPHYFAIVDNRKFLVLIPVMEIDSMFTGKRGASLPFSDYCEPILTEGFLLPEALQPIFDFGRKAGWKTFELRGGRESMAGKDPSSKFYQHKLDLSLGAEEIFANLKSSTRRNIRKAIKEGVRIVNNNSMESVEEFYRLNCLTRKQHGLPPQPFSFFKNVFRNILAKENGMVVLALYKRKTIAGAVYFHFGKKAIYKYGASDNTFQLLRANNLVMWEAIKWYSQHGFVNFSFGRTEQDNDGLRRFKGGWGGEEEIQHYYKYDFKKDSYINTPLNLAGWQSRIFRRTPLPILKTIGRMLYRHVG